MRNLPSFLISPVSSSFPTLPPISEGMEPTLDSCLPELLAQDLEISRKVFAAKNMTAGVPATCLPYQDSVGAMSFGHTSSTSSCPPPIPPRMRSLRTIQERRSMVSFVDKRRYSNYDASSDTDSSSDTELSVGMEAPYVSFREQSVATAATSVASTRPRASPRLSPQFPISRGCSWIDGDSDYEAPVDSITDRFACLSPRPPTPPELVSSAKGVASRGTRRHSHTMPQQYSYSAACTPSRSPERRLSIRSEDMALRRRSSLRVDSHEGIQSTTFNLAPFSSAQRPRLAETLEPISPLTPAPPPPDIVQPIMVDVHKVASLDSGFDDDIYSLQSRHYPRPQTIYIQPSPPPSPLPSVQSWLCNSSQPHASQLANDELAKAVPLPPDVIETLRVSIACFPETMLLTCSLTIETIRSYAKKVRHPSSEVMRSQSAEPRPPTPRKSIWRKVKSYRRGSPPGDHGRRDSINMEKPGLQSPSSSSLETVKPWAPLQHVFGNTSDYLCDALYAHIIAYNYISALIPRNSLPKSRRESHAPVEIQHEDIPKKAASLLGLSPAVDMLSTGASGLLKSASNTLLRDTSTSQVALSTSYENAVRDIQAGLMRCIARLVATARLVAESGSGEERLVEMGASEVDMLLTRSLCEVVRLAEETASGL